MIARKKPQGAIGMSSLLRWLALSLLLVGTHVLAQSTGTVTYVYTDPQGTPLAEADANGNITATFDYTPYGTYAPSGTSNPGSTPNGPGYTGHVNDPETNLVYMNARYYDPVTGRFISTDPIAPSLSTSQFNRYVYAGNNPIRNIDPTGMACGSTSDVSAGVQRMRETSDGCEASGTIVRAFNSSGKAYYVYADGGVVIQSGKRPDRDNNPGDIRKGSPTAISTTRAVGWDFTPTSANDVVTKKLPFAMFSSKVAGEQALMDTLTRVHGAQSILDAIKSYAPASDNNNPAAYSSFVTSRTGLSPNRSINSLNPQELRGVERAVETFEGVHNPQSTVYNNDFGPFSNP